LERRAKKTMLGSLRFDFLGALFSLLVVAMMILGGSPAIPPASAPPQGKTQAVNQKPDAWPEPVPTRTTNIPQKAGPKSTENVLPPSPGEGATQTVTHTVKRGESLPSLAHHYLPLTTYMTTAELEAAIRQANGGKIGKYLQPGAEVNIPGILTAPLVEHPVPVTKDFEMRGIYLTGYIAGSEQGLQLIRRWREAGGNAVAFDIKDMDGLVDIPFDHQLAPKRKYVPIRNVPKFARFLHSLGLHAIARIALFRDAYLAQSHPALAVQSHRTGQPWKENGKLVWTDPSQPEVQDYNIALARAVATSGVDEIQFDYVRFPAEGDQKDAQFAFLSSHPDWDRSDVINDFLSRAYKELHPLGVLVSVDVFGVMAWQRPVDLQHTGQDIAAIAQFCDVLSPMVYPSHFFGMEGYTRPGDAPEHFVTESMRRFGEITADTEVVLRPWLQAFAWHTKTYSDAYIRIQVSVAREQGGVGFLFWNARNDYSKLFPAMAEMRAAPSRFFRGDEIPASRPNSSASLPPANPAVTK
jgi:hypothetical protein